MNKALPRFLLTCLLAVALPLKGLAASSMLACGPNHHAAAATVAHAHGPVAPAHAHEHATATLAHSHGHGDAMAATPDHGHEHEHEHGDRAAHDHAAGPDAGTASELSAIPPGGATAAVHAPDLKDMSKCGTCAPCSVSAALTGDQPQRITAPANSADFPAFAAGHASPPAGRLDRPPRIFLA